MSGAERFLPSDTVAALHRLRQETVSPIILYGPMLEIFFVVSGTRRDVQHGMSVIPTGFLPMAVLGGNVQCYDLVNWTPDLAFLIADAANTRVRGCFIVTEVPTNA